MASAYVEYGAPALPASEGLSIGSGSSIYGKCVASEVLAISSTQATGAVLGTTAKTTARVTTDTACYVAVGSTPDCTVTTATSATGARRFLPAGATIDLLIRVGQTVAVKAVS